MLLLSPALAVTGTDLCSSLEGKTQCSLMGVASSSECWGQDHSSLHVRRLFELGIQGDQLITLPQDLDEQACLTAPMLHRIRSVSDHMHTGYQPQNPNVILLKESVDSTGYLYVQPPATGTLLGRLGPCRYWFVISGDVGTLSDPVWELMRLFLSAVGRGDIGDGKGWRLLPQHPHALLAHVDYQPSGQVKVDWDPVRMPIYRAYLCALGDRGSALTLCEAEGVFLLVVPQPIPFCFLLDLNGQQPWDASRLLKALGRLCVGFHQQSR